MLTLSSTRVLKNKVQFDFTDKKVYSSFREIALNNKLLFSGSIILGKNVCSCKLLHKEAHWSMTRLRQSARFFFDEAQRFHATVQIVMNFFIENTHGQS